tara:strand:- start:828 stop:1307 length:480 start_codon:yes stop_codon:yes gene_type:complete
MVADEAIFNKTEKPKKKLSEAQLKALAKGRAKVSEKRRLAEQKNNDKEIVKTRTIQKKEYKSKNKTIQLKKEEAIQERLKQESINRIEAFTRLKYKYMDKAKTLQELDDMKTVLDDIQEEDLMDLKKLSQTIIHKSKNLNKKSNTNINEKEDCGGDESE